MAVYAIGDVHGCLPELKALLVAVAFHPARDRLWFVGDLINRGPDSLGVLRLVKGLGERAVVVMGNHEGRLLASLSGCQDPGMASFVQELSAAPDAVALTAWLRGVPLFHDEPDLGVAMVHAGLSPLWSLEDARELSTELGRVLRDPHASRPFFQEWDDTILAASIPAEDRINRLRFAFSIMTRLRMCTADGQPLWPNHPLVAGLTNPYAFAPSESIRAADFPFRPWYVLRPSGEQARIVYGHWAAAGLTLNTRTWGLDSGCVYGGKLTALRLDQPESSPIQVCCPQYVKPESF
ncbi:MAG: symmetrical bis(5'-nucleosyl)-tetraphosphatase [Magnetococcus sp. MYC-9]